MKRSLGNYVKTMFQWLKTPPLWTGEHKDILFSEANNAVPSSDVTLQELIVESSQFPVPFPIDTVRCCQLKDKTSTKQLEKNINSAYPVIHEHALYLCSVFLLHQRKFGLKAVFYKNMSLLQFIDRLLNKRAVVFVTAVDHYMLLDGAKGSGNWENIGTCEEKPPLVLENCLSYDEMKLSALLSVSSFSHFVNDGDRNNCGRYEKDRNKIEDNGVIIGLIGPRLEKSRVMEYRDIVITKGQNTSAYGYYNSVIPTLQSEFLKFYDGLSDTYDQVLQQIHTNKDRYIGLGRGRFFDQTVYQKRLALSIDTLLIEANDRAKRENKMAYVHVVGLGLGVWKISSVQDRIFMETFAQRLELLSEQLTNVSDIRFAYIPEKTAGKYQNGDRINGITLHIANVNPHVKLQGDDEGKLLVVSYPWDGNAAPGNEFWAGSLNGSGDPAAASSSQIAELHNCHINRKVSASNLRVATFKGLVTFQEYQELHKND